MIFRGGCSHSRANTYFIESILAPITKNPFLAWRCSRWVIDCILYHTMEISSWLGDVTGGILMQYGTTPWRPVSALVM
jgi:hypothetical protein